MNEFKPSRLSAAFAQDVEKYAGFVEKHLAGGMTADELKPQRTSRGIYEQRKDNTFMVRVRIPGGALAACQARAIADLSSRHGTGMLYCTTRQDIQIHDVSLAETPTMLRRIFSAELTTKGGGGDSVRNIATCPLAGICPAERFDVTPCATATVNYLLSLPGSFTLPRKYKVAFSGCRADCALAQVNDLGFVAEVRNGQPGFIVYAGGGMGAVSRIADQMAEWIPAAEVIRYAEAGRQIFEKLGDRTNRRRARLRYVVESLGAEAFCGMLQDAVRAGAEAGVPTCDADATPATAPIPTPRGYREILTFGDGPQFFAQRQKGYLTVPIWLPLGKMSCRAMAALADIAEKFSAEKALRLSRSQDLLLRFVREEDREALRAALDAVPEIGCLRRSALHSFTSCVGATTCRIGLAPAPDTARACAAALDAAGIDQVVLRDAHIHINGCANACAQHPVGAIGMFGVNTKVGEATVPGFRILLGARRGAGHTRFGSVAGALPADAVPAFIVDLLRDFQNGRKPGESFADYFDRRALPHFQAIIGRHAPVVHE